MGVHLPGKGSYAIVAADTKEKSKDIKDVEKWVKIEPIRENVVPFWPFIKPKPVVRPEPEVKSKPRAEPQSLEELTRSVKNIESALNKLLERPSPPPPEVVAAHVKSIANLGEIPRGLPGAPPSPGPGMSQDPIYVPSRIKPEVKDGEISISSKDMSTDSVDESVNLLKQMRKKRKE